MRPWDHHPHSRNAASSDAAGAILGNQGLTPAWHGRVVTVTPAGRVICEPSEVQGLGSAPLQAEGLHLGNRLGAPLANTDPGAGLGAGRTQNCSLEGVDSFTENS